MKTPDRDNQEYADRMFKEQQRLRWEVANLECKLKNATVAYCDTRAKLRKYEQGGIISRLIHFIRGAK